MTRRLRLILAITAAVILLAAGGGALVAVQSQRATAAAESERRERDAERVAANDKAAAEREVAAEASERESRALTVTEIEGSVKTMADGNATDGLHEAVTSVACSPVDGGSTDDLTDQTTAFDCFAVTTDNPDGTQSGYYYNATVNWSTMAYTYGYGRSS